MRVHTNTHTVCVCVCVCECVPYTYSVHCIRVCMRTCVSRKLFTMRDERMHKLFTIIDNITYILFDELIIIFGDELVRLNALRARKQTFFVSGIDDVYIYIALFTSGVQIIT